MSCIHFFWCVYNTHTLRGITKVNTNKINREKEKKNREQTRERERGREREERKLKEVIVDQLIVY